MVPVPQLLVEKLTEDLARPRFHNRSVAYRLASIAGSSKRRAESFLKHAPIFQADFKRSNVPADMEEITATTKRLAEDPDVKPIQYSSRWVDADGNPLMFYLSHRCIEDMNRHKVTILSLNWTYKSELS